VTTSRQGADRATDDGETTGDPRWVVALGDEAATDPSLVGGKAATLSRLLRADLPVPTGVCVTTAVHHAVADEPSIGAEIDRLDSLDADAPALASVVGELRSHLRERPLPEPASAAIEAALPDAEVFAVRSSATAEDRPSASFAGQHETYLNVPREEVAERVRDCIAGCYTDRGVAYRTRNDVPHAAVRMAVLVQPMASADAAGVLFTADPATGNRTVASVDAGFGLGDALVGGRMTPDTARIDRRTGEVLGYDVGEKRVASRSRPAGGTERVDLPPAKRSARVLSDDRLRDLVDIGERVEALLDAPQDVEWALVDGRLLVLQSRPITSLFPLPEPAPADGRLHVYLSVGHLQAFPEAMPPLVQDVWATYVEREPEALGLERLWIDPVATAGGRVYIDLTPFLRTGLVRRRLPDWLTSLNEPAARGLADLLDRREEAFRRDRSPLAALSSVAAAASDLAGLAGLALRVLPPTLAGAVGALAGRPRDPESMLVGFEVWGRRAASEVREPETPAGRVRATFASIDIPRLLAELYPRIAPLFTAFAIGGWLRRRFPDAPEAVNAVGRGFDREIVTRLNLGLADLAELARSYPAVADALRAGASLDEVEGVEGGAVFRFAFDRYVEEFGHRATGEIDLSRPRWREDPSPLLGVIRADLAEDGPDRRPGEHRERVARLAREADAAAAELEQRAARGPLAPIRRRLVRHLVATYRRYVQTREYPKHGAARLFVAWRLALLDAGVRLVADGLLHSPEDVWFLRYEELLDALEGRGLGVDVEARRREFERHASLDAPALLTSEGEAPAARLDRDDLPPDTLVGTGVSAGVVEGVARVVRDPRTATIERGEILVAPSSDPGWTPLFLNAAGMVVEVGGPISHGALVAREYGLPAVVSVSGATRAIETGRRVRIDGTRGTVELLDDDEGEGENSDEGSGGDVDRDDGTDRTNRPAS
jgi:pyruvate,water dikinase